MATLPVSSVAVIGGGTMGTGIAQVFAQAGIPVTLIERTEADAARAVTTIRSNLDRLVANGKLDVAAAEELVGRVSTATAYQAAAGSPLVIEAVFERLDLKLEIARDLTP